METYREIKKLFPPLTENTKIYSFTNQDNRIAAVVHVYEIVSTMFTAATVLPWEENIIKLHYWRL